MADLVNSGFESDPDGALTGWDTNATVTSAFAHSGSKSVTGVPITALGRSHLSGVASGAGDGFSVTQVGWGYRNSGGTGLTMEIGHSNGVRTYIAGFINTTGNTMEVRRGDDSAGDHAPPETIDTISDVYADDTWQKFTLRVKLSTLTGGNANADGCISVYVDDVLVSETTNIIVGTNNVSSASSAGPWASGNNGYDWADWSFENGFVDDVRLSTDAFTCGEAPPTTSASPSVSPSAEPPPNIPPPDSVPCCGATPRPTDSQPIPPNPGDVLIGLQPWDRNCLGGGLVSQTDDVEDLELFAL